MFNLLLLLLLRTCIFVLFFFALMTITQQLADNNTLDVYLID